MRSVVCAPAKLALRSRKACCRSTPPSSDGDGISRETPSCAPSWTNTRAALQQPFVGVDAAEAEPRRVKRREAPARVAAERKRRGVADVQVLELRPERA